MMSDTMTEGVIVKWHKKVGDKVKSGDEIAEVETDKATMPLEVYDDGELLYVGAKEGDAVPVEQVVAIIGKKGEDYKALLSNSSKPAAAPVTEPSKNMSPSATTVATLPKGVKEIKMPLLSDTMTEGKIVKWNKKVGDKVKSDDALAEVETDKATMDVVGYEDGTLLNILVNTDEAAPINGTIALVGPAGTDVSAYAEYLKNKPAEQSKAEEPVPMTPASATPAPQTAPAPQPVHADASPVTENGRIKVSPLARRMAKEKGYNLTEIVGTGDGGRIIRRDVLNYTPAVTASIAAPAGKAEGPKEAALHMHSFAAIGQEGYEDVLNTQMRKTIARRLSQSKYQAPHFYLTMEINMDNAMKARKAMNEVSPVKISFNDLIIKACAMALREHPDVNSSWMGDFIRQNKHIHIGSAVAMPEGLIVPVIRFADQKSLSQIAAEAKGLYKKAKEKKLQPNEFSGNTFTISNLGMMDIDEFTAIINPPDSAILAVGKIKEIVVRKGDGFGFTNVMKVTLSCDHRAVDGAKGAAFLQTVKAFLENPVRMLI